MAARTRFARFACVAAAVCSFVSGIALAQSREEQAAWFRAVFEALRRNFPADFDRIAVESHRPNASTDAPTMLSNVFRKHSSDIGRAPAASLIAIAEAERKYILALQRHSETVCAMYGETGVVERDGLPSDLTELGLELGIRKLDAARAGIDHPVQRSLGMLSSEEDMAWTAAIRMAGATSRQIDILSGKTPSRSASPGDLCQAYVYKISSIISMMPESGAKIAAIRYTSS